MTITTFEKKYNNMVDLAKDISEIGYRDNVISVFLDDENVDPFINTADGEEYPENNDSNIYDAFIKAVLRQAYEELPSYTCMNNTIRVTVTNRRCYYSKDGYGFAISTYINKERNLVFVLNAEINKDPEILKVTKNKYYANFEKLGFDIALSEVGKR